MYTSFSFFFNSIPKDTSPELRDLLLKMLKRNAKDRIEFGKLERTSIFHGNHQTVYPVEILKQFILLKYSIILLMYFRGFFQASFPQTTRAISCSIM